jgi:TRAP-type C4-dicarboxylate transport system substrate-binding protein
VPEDDAALALSDDPESIGPPDDGLVPRDEFMRVIGATYYGKRHLTTGSKVVRTADDMKGFKLRIPEVDTFRAMAEAWGARPTPLNFGELYLALSQGAVDGQENPLPTIQSGKFFEVQKYLVLTGHIITPRLIVINEAAWQSLTPAQRQSLKTAIDTHGVAQDSEILAQESKLVETFKAGGMTVIQPDIESFRKPVLTAVPAKFEEAKKAMSDGGEGNSARLRAAKERVESTLHKMAETLYKAAQSAQQAEAANAASAGAAGSSSATSRAGASSARPSW